MALLGALAAAGCDEVGPMYQRPALDVPDSYTSAAVPAGEAPGVPTDWWRGFGSPELDALIDKAAGSSPDVQAAAARIIQADQAARVAGSPLLPGITASAGQNWERAGLNSGGLTSTGTTVGSTGFGSTLGQTDLTTPLAVGGSKKKYFEERSYTGTISASYEVDFWGENRDALRAAQATALGNRYDAQTVWLTTASSIATTYFQALSYRDRLAIAQHNYDTARNVLGYYRGRLAAGLASLLDVSQQEALVAGYRAQIPSFQSQYQQEVIALGILVGEAPERIHLSPVPLTKLNLPPVQPGMPADLLRRRPDVAYAEQQLISQNQTVRQDVAAFYPSLQLTAQGGVSSAALSAITGPGTLLASLASQLTQTIFDNGNKAGTLGEAKGRFKELAADYVKAVLQALTDVETALTQSSFSAEQESREADAVRTAQHAADIAHAQLEAGTVDIVTVLNTETTLFGDQDTLAQVRLSRFTALVSLYKALGGGWAIPAKLGENSTSPAIRRAFSALRCSRPSGRSGPVLENACRAAPSGASDSVERIFAQPLEHSRA
jgi:NodT family efflux transporter outer membrane factor (OMF) lipoprotein